MNLESAELKLRQLQHEDNQNHKDITKVIASNTSKSVTRLEFYTAIMLVLLATLLA